MIFTGSAEAVSAKRAEVIREVLTWEGTKFHHTAGVKGAGVDCAHLLIRVYSAVGLIEDFDPAYKPQWFQNRGEPLFLQAIEANGARQIQPAAAQAGDVLMYDFGRHAAHGAIVVDEHTLIHAYMPVGCVTLGSRAEFAHRLHSAWTLFEAIP